MMRSLLTMGAAAAVLLLAGVAGAEVKLEGKWQAVSITERGKTFKLPASATMVLVFNANGTFSTVAKAKGSSKSQAGKWTLKSDQLTTVTGGKRETMKISADGAKLTMKGRGMTMVYRRL